MPRPKKKILDTGKPFTLQTGPSQEFWNDRLNDIQQIQNRGRVEPPTVVRRVLEEPNVMAPPRDVPNFNITPEPNVRGPPQMRMPSNTGLRMRPSAPTTRTPPEELPIFETPHEVPRLQPTPPPSQPIDNPATRFAERWPQSQPVERPLPIERPLPVERPPVARNPFNGFEEDDLIPGVDAWESIAARTATNAGRAVAGAGRAAGRTLTTAAEAAGEAAGSAGIAAGEALGGIGGAIGLEGGAAMLAGGGIIGAGVLAAGLLGYGVYLLGKRLHDKFKAIHEKDGQNAALAALAREVQTNKSLNLKFQKNLSPEDMRVLNDHIQLHTEVNLGKAKRKEPESVQESAQVEQKDEPEVPETTKKRVFPDESGSTIHNTHKESIQITPTPKITTPVANQPADTRAEDKQMFQSPEPEKPIGGERDGHIYNPDRPQQSVPQQPKQSFQDNSINSIRPLNSQQKPRLSGNDYTYIRQRDPGYMV